MVLKEEYPKVINELYKLQPVTRGQVIADVTYDQVTPEIEPLIQELCLIPGVGRLTALELLFSIGINLE